MTGATVGTPAYMSPEQCAARDISGASDQYSLGIVAYEMLTGNPPFEAETLVGVLYAQCHTPPPPITDARPDLPRPLASAVMRMLEKEPGKRFANVEEAVKALGGTPLDLDDPRREEMKLLARSSTAAELRKRVKTPASPLPMGRNPPPTSAAGAVPTTRFSERSGPGAQRPTVTRRAWVLPVAGLAIVAGVAVAVTRPWVSKPGPVASAPRSQQLSQQAAGAPENTTAQTAVPPPYPTPPPGAPPRASGGRPPGRTVTAQGI